MESAELVQAVKDGDVSRVRELAPANPDARDENGVSALMLSRYHGAPPELTGAVRDARTAIDVFEAATLGETDVLRELLDADATLANAWSADRATALHFAAFFGQPQTAALLVERGADVHAVSPTFGDVTPLHSAAAASAESARIVHLLLEAGADPNARQGGGFTALHAAAQNGDTAMATDLLEHGADPTLATDDGRTPLSIAEEQGHGEVAALLREAR
ncbi:MAG TPA: ankyrin repeat domain-containing protein [Gaiellaceae bacterium]|nr:ankyrin repeat domain-containing protein [Gaiellaceae bacterium]